MPTAPLAPPPAVFDVEDEMFDLDLPWWGFRGRTTPRRLHSGHTVAACHSTIAEHLHRTTTRDTGWLVADLARLVGLWQAFGDRYATAGHEIALVRRRLAELEQAATTTPRPAGHSSYSPLPHWKDVTTV